MGKKQNAGKTPDPDAIRHFISQHIKKLKGPYTDEEKQGAFDEFKKSTEDVETRKTQLVKYWRMNPKKEALTKSQEIINATMHELLSNEFKEALDGYPKVEEKFEKEIQVVGEEEKDEKSIA